MARESKPNSKGARPAKPSTGADLESGAQPWTMADAPRGSMDAAIAAIAANLREPGFGGSADG